MACQGRFETQSDSDGDACDEVGLSEDSNFIPYVVGSRGPATTGSFVSSNFVFRAAALFLSAQWQVAGESRRERAKVQMAERRSRSIFSTMSADA
jgi:hypothetical protein